MLIGAAGAGSFKVGSAHRTNIGYWLARPSWNRGIMTEAVGRFVDYAFAELEVVRLTAEVPAGNEASVRMLKRNGFTEAGRLHCRCKTDDDLTDVLYLGLLRAGLDTPP